MKYETLDLDFMGRHGVIAAYLLFGDDSAALVETGPTTGLQALLSGLTEHGVAPEEVGQVFLTHVHLDHAGAAGNLADLLPNAVFYVHEVGYPHMADPSKLVRSATRIYGDRMEELWGEVRPVPEGRLVALKGGESVEAAGSVLVAHDTPGHAYHHLAYFEPESGALFAGDVAGIRLQGQAYVRPPTVPPEFDAEAWKGSIEDIRKLAPSTILPTHFGPFEDVERHLAELEQRLAAWLLFVEERVDGGMDGAEIAEDLEAASEEELLSEGAPPGESERYQLAGNMEMLVSGLVRYVTKRRESA
jgi:glyoxylase-like metal-dependent hydrolase (beta-lactamase superfamily II)